jgi:hypothetical protein
MKLLFVFGLFFFGFEVILAEFLLEPFDTTGGIDKFLLAGVERMAHGTNFGVNVFGRTAGLKGIAATTADLYDLINRMYIFFHSCLSTFVFELRRLKIIPIQWKIARVFLIDKRPRVSICLPP